MKPKVLTSQLIKNISDHHAQLINKVRYGNMVLRGDTLYVLEMQPAGYAFYAANEAEKASHINIINVSGFGSFGRVYIAGDEAEVLVSKEIVESRLAAWRGARRGEADKRNQEEEMESVYSDALGHDRVPRVCGDGGSLGCDGEGGEGGADRATRRPAGAT